MANKHNVLSVFIDIEKAYDMVNKQALLSKLLSYGISGRLFHFIRSFLSKRTKRSEKKNSERKSVFAIGQSRRHFLECFFGQVWENMAKILRTCKNLPAPAPMLEEPPTDRDL